MSASLDIPLTFTVLAQGAPRLLTCSPTECSPAEWLLSLIGLGALALFGYVVWSICSLSQRRRHQRKFVDQDDSGSPQFVTSASGEVLWSNTAATLGASLPPGGMLGLLSRHIEISGPELYRLSRLINRRGLAVERFPSRGKPESLTVVAQTMPDRCMIWRLVDTEHVGGHFQADAGEPFDALPFAFVCFRDGVEVRHNRLYRERFGNEASLRLTEVLPELLADADFSMPLLSLPGPDGEDRLSRCVLLRRRTDGSETVEIYFRPTTEGVESEIAAEEMLDALPVALLNLDMKGNVSWGNAQARQMLGGAFATNEPLDKLIEPFGRTIKAVIDETVSGDKSGGVEMVRLGDVDAETFAQVTLTKVSVCNQDRLLAVLTDASALRQLEDKFAQSQKMEAVGKLAGGVAHDFNNVLTAISGHCDLLLLRKDASHPDFSDLTQIRQNATRAAALVRQLLAFSRKQTLQPRLLSVQDVVTDTLYLLDRLIGETVSLTLNHDRELGSVRADHQQLEQALMNLVVNARDAMPNGGSVVIATRNREEPVEVRRSGVTIPPGDYVEISVRDNGSGIDPNVIGKVFDPFFTTKPKGEGTGLGLSTVYGIVKQSGGYIFVENLPEGGACFSIYLPRVYPDEREIAMQARQDTQSSGDLTGEGTVLLVEDEAPVRSFASRALRLRGYKVLEADCAEAAMSIIESGQDDIDIIVSDVVMPGMDGPTFAAKARLLHPSMKVIFVSGYAEDSFRRNLTDTDFLFLPKPFSLNDLTTKVKEALTDVERHAEDALPDKVRDTARG